jgi:murein DD-endopeptidase MepM/ murein hydrolase activator NlpD
MNPLFNLSLLKNRLLLTVMTLLMALLACSMPRTTVGERRNSIPTLETFQDASEFFPRPTEGPYADFSFLPVLRKPGDVVPTPSPDPERSLPPIRTSYETYYIRYGDTLGTIALKFGVPVSAISIENGISDQNLISVGQALRIPPPTPTEPAPDLKLIPDSELVNGPYNAKIDLIAYIQGQGGYLNDYQEDINEIPYSGPEIVELVATNYSVNPRLLLAILEYQSGWLTKTEAEITEFTYPMGIMDDWRAGLYFQLAWAANTLNSGFYRWRVNGLGGYPTADHKLIPASPRINAGTAALHYMFAQIQAEEAWRKTVSANGFIQTYQDLYGHPFDWAIKPLIPPGLSQPDLQLPFEPGVRWIFTGGPHGGWDGGSAWSAVDFAPPKEQFGCLQNDEWVVAMADGLIVRSGNGAVIQDLDGDGHEETGWVLFYMHIETRDRVPSGTILKAGDKIGHASCEGGISTGTHVHLARRYNGEWIAINSEIPFVMDGWTVHDDGILYGGYLEKNGQVIYPCQCKDEENKIERPQ